MGHYDDCYEGTRISDEKKRRDNLQHWVSEKLEDMEDHELEIMYEVASNVEEYYGFMQVIMRIAATKRI